ncbi:hypothetical protein AB0912_27900, partial [Streptomyces sp. NPDC007084]
MHDSAGGPVAGRYLLLGLVLREEGRSCWLGRDAALDRPVLVTRSRLAAPVREESPAHAGESARDLRGETREGVADRVLRTAGLLGAACPGRVPAVLDVIEEPGTVWTVTERPPGAPLTDLLAGGPAGHVRAARVGLGVLDVLTAAHGSGVTHGELGPGQVWADESGAVTVTGFGLPESGDAPRVTAPAYASPEQARGEGGGAAADLWALGAMMYALVEGRPPVRDRGRLDATLRAVDRLPIRAPLRAGPLGPAVRGLLRWDPVERVPESVVREALTRILRQDLEEPESPGPSDPPTVPLGSRAQDFPEREREREWNREREAGVRGRTGAARSAGRPLVLGGVLAVTVAVLGVFAATGGLPGVGAAGASG